MPKRSSQIVLSAVVVSLFLSGCGNDCQSTCTKLYGTTPNCGGPNEAIGTIGLVQNGESESKKMRQCMTACETGLEKPGEVGDYDPEDPSTPRDVTLDNDRQVAVWMDCIASNDCSNLETGGYCRPVW